MAELIHQHSARVRSREGVVYTVRICGERRPDGKWEGWLEFHPEDASRPVLRTGRETTQPEHHDLVYWASGLEAIYLDGALERAH